MLNALCSLSTLPKLMGQKEGGWTFTKKVLLIMKLTAILLLLACLAANATGYSQSITIKKRSATLDQVFIEINKQAGYNFLYKDEWLRNTKKVDIDVQNATIEQVLDICFKNQPFSFSIINKTIVLKQKLVVPNDEPTVNNEPSPPITVRGRVVNENGEGVIANIIIKGTQNGTTTNTDGYFELKNVDEQAVLIISGISLAEKIEINVNAKTNLGNIATETKMVEGESVTLSTGYWTTTKQRSLGNISKVTAKDIERQPVTSLLMALQGRMPGVDITPYNGAAGGAVTVQIRGFNSLRFDGGDPLYVIDGVPINSRPIDIGGSSLGSYLYNIGLDPLSTLDPASIESIEVLKDADATAIYGSRGANGVIIISTKKRGQVGKTSVDVSYYHGISNIPNRIKLLNKREYLDMRYEAYKNDGINLGTQSLGSRNYDLLVWDTTRSTDWQKELLGGNAHVNDFSLRISGGSGTTSFSGNIGYHTEGVVFPGDFGFQRVSGQFSITHRSINQKLFMQLTASYGETESQQYNDQNFIGSALSLPPVAPKLYNADGSLNWEISNLFSTPRNTWTNPLSALNSTQDSKVSNMLLNGIFSYQFSPHLTLKTTLGFTKLIGNDQSKRPSTSSSPTSSFISRTASFGTNDRSSWIVEPQLTFSKKIRSHTFNALAGLSFQSSVSQSVSITGTNYSSDILLNSIDGALTKEYRSTSGEYRYAAVFLQASYDWKDKYLVNITGRRDGSSRFGPGRQFGNFGSASAGWIFSKESFIMKNFQFLSFGKFRMSYGITGNDQIGDYNYLQRYTIPTGSYQGVNLVPAALFNPDYAWEATRKFEAAIELGFLKNRISIELSRYLHRSSNQLVQYTLPGITGFSSVLENFDAVIDNTGWEFILKTTNILQKNFQWSSTFNFSDPQNKLVKYEGIEQSSYGGIYAIGQPLTIQHLYTWNGINKGTGLHEIKDINGDGIINASDRQFMKPLGRQYYGGLANAITFKNFALSVLLQFSKSTNSFFLPTPYPGLFLANASNQPILALQRWQKPGNETTVGRFSQSTSIANVYSSQVLYSDLNTKDVFFVRLRTFSLSYNLSAKMFQKKIFKQMQMFFQGQNLLTLTKYKEVLDPETGNGLPPLRVFSIGLQARF